MNPTTEQAATRIVEALVEDQAQFSAHDITTLLRAEGLTVRHNGADGVRQFVHDLMNQGNPMFVDYNRDVSPSLGAFIYHHYNDDVNDYDPDEHRSATNVTTGTAVGAPTTTVGSSTTVGSPTIVDDGKVNVDQRGRLCVRAALLRQLGVKPGNQVYVDIGVASIFKHCNSVNDSVLVVDRDNCLRLSNRTLYKMFGDPTPDRFELVFDTDHALAFIKVEH